MKMNFSLLQNQEYNKVIYIDKIHDIEVEALGFMKMGREAKIHEGWIVTKFMIMGLRLRFHENGERSKNS